MRKKIVMILVGVTVLLLANFILNLKVSTYRGVNFKVSVIKLPLYLKVMDFIDRHYSYKNLVSGLVNRKDSPEEKAVKLLKWTYENIKEQPASLPVIDDHSWHVIIRGYGVDDQFSDVFSTLCNYAGVEAVYHWVYSEDKTTRIPLSFVKLDNKWFLFDPFRGVYFVDASDKLLEIDLIRSADPWFVHKEPGAKDINYKLYLNNLPKIEKNGLGRVSIQSPFRRLLFQVRKMLKIKNDR